MTIPTEHPLRRFRMEKALSLADLAKAAGVDKSTLSRVERGRNPSMKLIRRLIEVSGGALAAEDFISPGARDGAALSTGE